MTSETGHLAVEMSSKIQTESESAFPMPICKEAENSGPRPRYVWKEPEYPVPIPLPHILQPIPDCYKNQETLVPLPFVCSSRKGE